MVEAGHNMTYHDESDGDDGVTDELMQLLHLHRR